MLHQNVAERPVDFSISFSSHPGGSDTVASCTDRSSPSKDHQMDMDMDRWADLEKAVNIILFFSS